MSKKSLVITILMALSIVLAACSARTPEITAQIEMVPAAVEAAPTAASQAAQPAPTTEAAAAPEAQQPAAADAAIIEPALAASQLDTLPLGVLSAEEAAGLAYMREEEKLAHDVYLALYAATGLQSFQNIANSEQTHTDAVKNLLDRYALPDPSAGKLEGQFSDPNLQALYDQLAAQGSQSLAEALKVGAAVEEIDILDLQTRMAQTTLADILLVYQSLEQGSENHLRAFTSRLLNQTGETYQPQYLSQDAYQAIITASGTTGAGTGMGSGNGNGGNGQGGRNQP